MNEDPESWPDELDALIASPQHHKLLLENDQVRVLETRIPVGERTPVHTHRWPSVLHIVTPGAFVRYDPDGNKTFDTRADGGLQDAPPAVWTAPLPPHAVESVGAVDWHAISVEIKDRRPPR